MFKARCWILGTILALAGFVRLFGLAQQGILEHDEGGFLLTADLLVRPIQWVYRNSQPLIEGEILLREVAHILPRPGRQLFYPPDSKVGFHLLLAIGLLFSGFHDNLGAFVSAIFGTSTILLVYAMTSKANSTPHGTAYVAALILALSPYHILYSRLGLAQATATCFVMLGITLYFQGCRSTHAIRQRKWLIGSGAAMAFGAAVHPSAWISLAAVALAEFMSLGWRSRFQHWQGPVRRFAIFALGALGPLLLFQAGSEIMLLVKRIVLPQAAWNASYLSSILAWVNENRSVAYGPPEPWYYARRFLDLNGTPAAALATLGLLYALRKSSSNPLIRFLLCQFLLLFAALSVNTLQVPRAFTQALPLVSMLEAFGIVALVNLLRRTLPRLNREHFSKFLTSVLLVCIVGPQVPTISSILNMHSGYRKAMAYLVEVGDGLHFSTNRAISNVYVGLEKAAYPAGTLQSLRRIALQENRWFLLVDEPGQRWPVVPSVRDQCDPVAVIENPVGPKGFLLEDQVNDKRIFAALNDNPHWGIEIYDIRNCLGPSPDYRPRQSSR